MEYKLKHILQQEKVTSILCTALSPTGLHIGAGSDSGCLDVWLVDRGKHMWACEGHVAHLVIHWLVLPSGEQDEHLLCSYADGTFSIIKVFDVHTILQILCLF